jgi:AcrR family transcriptional regulator
MAQTLKDNVKESIVASAVKVFARDGYDGATVASIAGSAGISTGNVYRYFDSKETLFEAAIPPSFVDGFLALLRAQLRAARGLADLDTLPPDAPYRVAAEELLRFAIENRLRLIVLLGRSRGSRYEKTAETIVQELVEQAIAHFRELRPGLRLSAPVRLMIEQAYRSLVATVVLVLATFDDADRIRAAVTAYSRFHLSGLKALFEGIETGPRNRKHS